jgi:hypothetical protein
VCSHELKGEETVNRKETLITRRSALQGAASLLGSTLASAQLAALPGRLALAADGDTAPVFFDADQFALLERAVDIILPETDTPGAAAAGVHRLIDLMLAEWASPERQARYVDGLRSLDTRMQAIGPADFVSAAPGEQLALLQALDREAEANAYSDTFFAEFKKLVLFGYYSSEAGATLELQYEPLTPDYKACVPIEDIGGRAWFWLGFSHGL